MKIAIGCDHGGFELKQSVLEYLNKNGYEFEDFGTYTADSVDYPDIAIKVAEAVAANEFERGILICGTGIGIGISANKVPGIRCAIVSDPYSAQLTREHNNANMIAFGGRVIGTGLAEMIVEKFLTTEFSNGERHIKRLDKITAIEKKYNK